LHGAHLTYASLGPTKFKSQMASAIFAQLTAECRYTLQWVASFPLKIIPSHGRYGPPSSTIPWAHSSPKLKRHLYWFSHFCTHDCRVSLYFKIGRPFTPQNCLFPRRMWTPSNTWFLGPTRVLNPNSISIGSAGLTSATDRLTDRSTDHATRSVTIGCIYVHSTAMRTKMHQQDGTRFLSEN